MYNRYLWEKKRDEFGLIEKIRKYPPQHSSFTYCIIMMGPNTYTYHICKCFPPQPSALLGNGNKKTNYNTGVIHVHSITIFTVRALKKESFLWYMFAVSKLHEICQIGIVRLTGSHSLSPTVVSRDTPWQSTIKHCTWKRYW